MTTRATGSFDVTITAEPPRYEEGGIKLQRASLVKQFHGPLEARSSGEMIGARTAVAGSAGYVAIELVVGSLDGRAGSFVLQHASTMTRGAAAQSITVVPDSGTGALAGLTGSMTIDVVDDGKQHLYTFDYAIG
jgi:Protein of unknown function (DUF3224)